MEIYVTFLFFFMETKRKLLVEEIKMYLTFSLTLVRQHAMKSLLPVCSSVHPSITNFSQYWVISFFLILCKMIAGRDI